MTLPPRANETRLFLDSRRYTQQDIAKYQSVFGDGFISPGGLRETQEFAKYLELKPDQQVLDVGCGVGGAAVYLAREVRQVIERLRIHASACVMCKSVRIYEIN